MGILEGPEVMREFVFSRMERREREGKLNKAHSYDHMTNVSQYAGMTARYFGDHLGVSDSDKLVPWAQMTGYAHDIVRYASETKRGDKESARILKRAYRDVFSDVVPEAEYNRFVVDIVRNSELGLEDMTSHYQDDPEACAVALAVMTGDKLMEASGPRVLQRRSYFVGRDRMLNTDDLGAVFKYPDESSLGVLSETMARLGGKNHISNYSPFPPLLVLAQELHASQYQFYAGLLAKHHMTPHEALRFLWWRLSDNQPTRKLAERFIEKAERLIDEDHLTGEYFDEHGLDVLADAVRHLPRDLAKSSALMVKTFSTADSPNDPVNRYEKRPFGPPTFREWMDEIIAYRDGEYGVKLLEKLEVA